MNLLADEYSGAVCKVPDRMTLVENGLDEHDSDVYRKDPKGAFTMPSRRQLQQQATNMTALMSLMEDWPKSWAGDDDDEPVGRDLVAVLRRFMMHLQQQELSRRTFRRHLDNLWLIGGETIRKLDDEPGLRDKSAHELLLESIYDGEAPLVGDLTQEQQSSLDATARKLLKFLSTEHRHT